MSNARSWIPFVVLAGLALIALLIAGSRELGVRTFALNAPNQTPVAVLRPSHPLCQGPVSSRGPAQSVKIWGAAVGGPAGLTVDVSDSQTERLLADGRLRATVKPQAYQTRLSKTVPGGHPLRVCVTADTNSFSLLGSPAAHPNVVMTGGKPGFEFSLVLLHDTGQSFLGSLGAAFSRASLYRPTWVGSWTFWLLTGALVGLIILGAVAIRAAASADGEDQGQVPER